MLDRQFAHAVFRRGNHDDVARERFAINFQGFCFGTLQPANVPLYEKVVRPAFERTHGRPPADRHEVRRELEKVPVYQAFSSLRRLAQELNWSSIQDTLDREADDLIARARSIAGRTKKKGSLRLDPSIKAPRYLTAVDIHIMPGNYHTEYAPDDVYQGALLDRGGYILNRGGRGPRYDSLGYDLLTHLRRRRPGCAPKRIVDMGCSVGAPAIPLAQAFPRAEFHAIDVAAPMLRYGHARAEGMGSAIHFSQQDAEHTDFADGSFDLVISCLLLHETSNKAIRGIMRESQRLLAPGGVTLHIDGAYTKWRGKSLIDQAQGDWSTHYNAEPFISALGDLDLAGIMVEAGFARQAVAVETAPNGYAIIVEAKK
jgi:SAM-dependent methyltransferase